MCANGIHNVGSANGAVIAKQEPVPEAAAKRFSALLAPFLRLQLSSKAIDKLVRDPRLYYFFQRLFANHRPDEILKVSVISSHQQITIQATLNRQVTQCGVDSSRDGYSAKRVCTTSNVITSESTLKLDRSYVARLNARPSIYVKPQTSPDVAKATETAKQEAPHPQKEPVVDWNSQQSVVDWYDEIYARTAGPRRHPPPPVEEQKSVVINRDPPGTSSPGTLMRAMTRKLTPGEALSQDVFREELGRKERLHEEWKQTEKRGSNSIVLKKEFDQDHFSLEKQGVADKMARFIWLDGKKVPPGQMGSSLHRLLINRSAKWEKLLGRDANILPVFEEVQSDLRADRQLVADVFLMLTQFIPGPAVSAQTMINGRMVDTQQTLPLATYVAMKLLEGTYKEINEETVSRHIWIHAWIGKIIKHPALLTDESIQELSPTARQILKFVMRRWSGTSAYSSYWPVFRRIEQHHYRALAGTWVPYTVAHLEDFPNRYLFVTNWAAEVGRSSSRDHKQIASQMRLEEYEILKTLIVGEHYSPDENAGGIRNILSEAGQLLRTEAQNN